MTLAGKITTLHHKINAYKAQYYLGRETAKTSAQSSGKLDKYEYLTDQDLPPKPGVIEQKQFEYSPLRENFKKQTKK